MKNCEACKTAESRISNESGDFWGDIWAIALAVVIGATAVFVAFMMHLVNAEVWSYLAGLVGLACSIFVLIGLHHVLIGKYSYCYSDQGGGGSHQHIDPPSYTPSVLIRLRHGGIFRRAKIVFGEKARMGQWHIRNWDGTRDIELWNREKTEAIRVNILAHALMVLENHSDVSNLFCVVEMHDRLNKEIEKLDVERTGLYHDINSLLLFVESVASALSKKSRWSDADRAIASNYEELLDRLDNESPSRPRGRAHGHDLHFRLIEPVGRRGSLAPEVPAEPASQVVPPN